MVSLRAVRVHSVRSFKHSLIHHTVLSSALVVFEDRTQMQEELHHLFSQWQSECQNRHNAATSLCRGEGGTVCSCTCHCCCCRRLIKMISHCRRHKPQKLHQSLEVSCCRAETSRLLAAYSTFFSSNYWQQRTFKSPVLLFFFLHCRGEITGSALQREREKEMMGALGHISSKRVWSVRELFRCPGLKIGSIYLKLYQWTDLVRKK